MKLIINCDGGSRGNPGPSACGFVVKDGAGILQEKRGKYLGVGTNNEAEYEAVIEAWGFINEKFKNREENLEIEFKLDSNLVVNQVNGNFKVKEPRLKALLMKIRQGESMLNFSASYSYIPREQNADADLLVNQTLDKEV